MSARPDPSDARLDALLDGLDPEQREAVLSPGAPLCILAGAGSGKTRVLTRRIARRIADGSADASHVLALTFTRQAATELVHRLGALGLRDRPTAGTFHGVAFGVLRQRWADQDRRPPELLTSRARFLTDLVGQERSIRGRIGELTTEIDWAKARLIGPDAYATAAVEHGRRSGLTAATVAEQYERYEAAKRSKRLVDFDDLLLLCAREIQHDAAFAEVQRWRFRHLFVDELQDVNPLQVRLLEAWRGGRADLCVVGDTNQAIYGWNGADPSWLADVSRHYPGVTIVRLRHNYRSTPQVMGAAAGVLRRGGLLVDTADAPSGARPDGPEPTVRRFADEGAEARGIVELLRRRGPEARRWSSCAVLVRTNAQTAPIEQALRAAGIPCRVRTALTTLDHAGVRAALRDLTGYVGANPLRSWAEDLQGALEDDGGAAADDPLRQLAAWARAYLDSGHERSAPAFRLWLSSGGPHEVGSGRESVDVLTFHAAKGLEWPFVVVAGMEAGLVPHSGAHSTAARDEETRLAYVAFTRAEDELHLTWAARRGTGRGDREPSPYLPEGRADEPVVVPMEVRAAARRVPDASRPAGDGLGEALFRWRAGLARLSGLPDAAVLSDRALRAVAASRPCSIDELAAIEDVGVLAARRLGPRILSVIAGIEAIDA